MKSKTSKMEISNVKDAILMPPPKAPTKPRSDTSEELRRNLIETVANIHDNTILQEEISKIMNREDTSSFDSSNKNRQYPLIYSTLHDNNTSFSDEDINNDYKNSMEKLRNNLSNIQDEKNFMQFKKLPPPVNKRQLKAFVENLICYLDNYDTDENFLLLKIKIETRYNDFKNKGLKQDYFKESLIKMQSELIGKICPNTEESTIINGEYRNLLHKKRKRSLTEMKSVTSSSSSSDD